MRPENIQWRQIGRMKSRRQKKEQIESTISDVRNKSK